MVGHKIDQQGIQPLQGKLEAITKINICDAMMHVLKDSINLKYSELLTKPISKCYLI